MTPVIASANNATVGLISGLAFISLGYLCIKYAAVIAEKNSRSSKRFVKLITFGLTDGGSINTQERFAATNRRCGIVCTGVGILIVLSVLFFR